VNVSILFFCFNLIISIFSLNNFATKWFEMWRRDTTQSDVKAILVLQDMFNRLTSGFVYFYKKLKHKKHAFVFFRTVFLCITGRNVRNEKQSESRNLEVIYANLF
jgi:hypothetical protein